MHFEFLVEELSTEAALTNLIPNILEAEHTFAIHSFQGKADLLNNLPPGSLARLSDMDSRRLEDCRPH